MRFLCLFIGWCMPLIALSFVPSRSYLSFNRKNEARTPSKDGNIAVRSLAGGEDGEEQTSKDFIIGYTVRRKGDGRETLPFVVVEVGSQQGEVGTFTLDSSTSCGDILELGDKGVYKVKRVRFLYKYDGRKYKVFKKKLDAVALSKSPFSTTTGMDTGDMLQ
mmetsp:Transcript_6994/g.11676  ORF Transcript_6994/g.11676 Transcript_6994/m.11676 type:complete len:162 (+) Transcript_6994:54-539(+)